MGTITFCTTDKEVKHHQYPLGSSYAAEKPPSAELSNKTPESRTNPPATQPTGPTHRQDDPQKGEEQCSRIPTGLPKLPGSQSFQLSAYQRRNLGKFAAKSAGSDSLIFQREHGVH